MNTKIRNALFFFIVFALIFNDIPKLVQLSFIGGPVGSRLVVYPLLLGFAYSFWCQHKGYKVWTDIKPFSRYIIVYIGVMLLAVISGLIQYPYYDLVLNGPVGQIEKLPRVLDILHSRGIDVDSKLLLQAWIIVRQIKAVFLEAFWCFGGAYMIYCWYKDDALTGIKIMTQAVGAAIVILVMYAMVETSYLAGNASAANILSTINPYIHTIVTNHGWWPPLLWPNQMRLVFTEPSCVGNYMAFVIPIVCGVCLYCKRKFYSVLAFISIALLAFMVFLTKARTAYAMLVGMLVLLLILLVIGKDWKSLKRYSIIVLCVIAGFVGYVQFSAVNTVQVQKVAQPAAQQPTSQKTASQSAMVAPKTKAVNTPKEKVPTVTSKQIAADAIENNLGSLMSSNKRSNKARFTLIKANLYVGIEHPLLGVGPGMHSAYVEKYLVPEAGTNPEITNWVQRQHKYGPMSAGNSIPDSLNEYVSKFSGTGILGCIVSYALFALILVKLFKRLRQGDNKALVMTFVLCSSLAAGCNMSLNTFYCAWVLLGLSYALCFGKYKNDDVQKELE